MNSKNNILLRLIFEKGYTIDKFGIVKNPKGKTIKGSVNNSGYIKFSIRNNEMNISSASIHFHRMQAYKKYGERIFKQGVVVRHLNGNALDNRESNVVIGSQSDNMMDRDQIDRLNHAKHASSFVKKHDKEKIKKFHSICKSYKKTMSEFNISSKGTLHFILNTP